MRCPASKVPVGSWQQMSIARCWPATTPKILEHSSAWWRRGRSCDLSRAGPGRVENDTQFDEVLGQNTKFRRFTTTGRLFAKRFLWFHVLKLTYRLRFHGSRRSNSVFPGIDQAPLRRDACFLSSVMFSAQTSRNGTWQVRFR